MNNNKQLLLKQAKRVLKQNGLSWSEIKGSAQEIVVFGSASVGLKRPTSDLDLLVVGNGRRFKNRQLDIVYKTEQEVKERRWLGSELAGHIAASGSVRRLRLAGRGRAGSGLHRVSRWRPLP